MFIRKKRIQNVWIDTRADSESCPSGSLNTFMGHFFRVSFDQSSCLPGSESIFGMSQAPPMCARASLSRDGFYYEGPWVDYPLASFTFDLQGAFLPTWDRRGLLTLRMRNMWSLIFYLGRSQPSPSTVLLFLSWSFSPQRTTPAICPSSPSISCFSMVRDKVKTVFWPGKSHG